MKTSYKRFTLEAETLGAIHAITVEEASLGLFHVSHSHVTMSKPKPSNTPNLIDSSAATYGGAPVEVCGSKEEAEQFAGRIVDRLKAEGFTVVDQDDEPPSSNGGFQTHVRNMPPGR